MKLKELLSNGDGWIAHQGDHCPVAPDTKVYVAYQLDLIFDDVLGPPFRAGDLVWNHKGSPDTWIVAYRIAKDDEEEPAFAGHFDVPHADVPLQA